MLKNSLKRTLRVVWKTKTYSFLNIFGLAIGITCAGLIFLWAEDEYNFDDVHLKKDRLYEVEVNSTYDGNSFTMVSTPRPLGTAMHAEIPGIANNALVFIIRDETARTQHGAAYETTVGQ